MFDAIVSAEAMADAGNRFPEESCGLVVDGKYISMPNLAEDPLNDFKVNAVKYIMNGTLQGVIHSHPVRVLVEASHPSIKDMQQQIATGVPWGIIDTDGEVVRKPYWWGDHQLTEELIGKEFHCGVEDCYSIVRKYYFQKHGIKLKNHPRVMDWWKEGKDFYKDGFESAGFYRISKEELKDGDGVLLNVQSNVLNHAAIYLDNKTDGRGVILHHLPGRLSRRETAGPWLAKANFFLRHKDVT